MTVERDHVLLTGATGFLGMELLARYLERTDQTVMPLVRADDAQSARDRIDRVLELLYGHGEFDRERVIPIPGDVQEEGLGLRSADRRLVRDRVGLIVHCAATVSFTAGLEESRQINVEGTRRMIELASDFAEPPGFAHVSTAYVAGEHAGPFGENDLDVGQRFRNPYERSKFEAEQLVRSRAGRLPSVTILRPSIIVGESQTGWTPAFNVIYVPLRAFVERRLRVLPAQGSAPVDVVPADYVADSILELTRGDQPGVSTYHLVAGEQATTVSELVELSARLLRRRPPPLVSPALYRCARPLLSACLGPRRRRALRRTAPFLPYYTMRVQYRRERTARRLDPCGLRPPSLRSYYDRLLGYATASHWGSSPLPRPQSAPAAPLLR